MPYSNNSQLPEQIRGAIPSESGKTQFRAVFNNSIKEKPEADAFKDAWAALKNAGYEKDDKGKWTKLDKRQITDDTFTDKESAVIRSHDMGYGGSVHAVSTADGLKVYRPGNNSEDYVEGEPVDVIVVPPVTNPPPVKISQEEEPDQVSENLLATLTRVIMRVLSQERSEVEPDNTYVIKSEKDRMVWGWASVVSEDGKSVVDSDGDIIPASEMLKAANDFMLDVRKASIMHDGSEVGVVVHSWPVTNEIAKQFGMNTNKEGWMVAMKILDDDVWERVQKGELSMFSIGGEGIRNAI